MRTHVFKTSFATGIGGGVAAHRSLVLAYRVTGTDTVEIDRVIVNGADDHTRWLRCQIEADSALAADLLTKAADDLAYDASKVIAVEIGRAA